MLCMLFVGLSVCYLLSNIYIMLVNKNALGLSSMLPVYRGYADRTVPP